MDHSRVSSVRPTLRSLIYVVAVTLLAAVGFGGESPWPILLAAVIALPASIVALSSYYVVYGVLALIPGANPSSASGTGTSTADGRILTSVVTGSPAVWFTITTQVLGILALSLAAAANVLLLRALAARRRARNPVLEQGD